MVVDIQKSNFQISARMVVDHETAQEIFEYSRRGLIEDLTEVVSKVHPDTYVAYDGSTALLIACKNGHTKVCELLLEQEADLSMRTEDGTTALILAAATGRADLVHLVHSRRPGDINEVNEDGFTPLDIARYYNHAEVVLFLEKNGGVSGTVEQQSGPSEVWGYGVFD